jgi:hypothetical protein
MNKAYKPAPNCRTVKQAALPDAVADRPQDNSWSRGRVICSYTNDFARTAESCQAPQEAKNAAAD